MAASTNSFDLIVVGAANHQGSTISDVELIFSTPQGQTGNIFVDGNLVTGMLNDKEDILTLDVSFNNHSPFQNAISDFSYFKVGDFALNSGTFPDYNAETGIITSESSYGHIETFNVSFSGFTQVHIDAIGWNGTAWKINPGSHDSTAIHVPAPGALILSSIGIGIAGWLRKRQVL